MKNADDNLLSYLNSKTSYQSCDLYVLKLADGTVYRFAAYDKDIVLSGERYYHNPFKFKRDQIKLQGAPNVDSLSVTIYAEPQDKLGDKAFMKAVHNGSLDGSMLGLYRAYFDDHECVGALHLFFGRCEVSSAGGLTVKLTVKSELQGLAAMIPTRVFVGQSSYVNAGGTVVTSSTEQSNMLIPLKPSMNVLLQV